MNDSKLLSCRCAIDDIMIELHVIIYDVMFYCFEILVVYDIISVMSL